MAWLPGLALVALPLLAYAPALNGEFIWDDVDIYVVQNPLLRASDGLFRFWFTTEARDYYPLAYSLYWIEWRLFGDSPAGYHVVNVLLHGFACVVLWRLLVRASIPAAWMAAAIFALHPVNVEAVAWIAQAKSILAGLFGFAAVYCHVRYNESAQDRWYWASALCFGLSLSAKPTLIFLPLALAAFSWWKGDTLASTVKHSAPYFVLCLLFGLVGVWFQEENIVGQDVVRQQSLWDRAVTAGWAVWFYVYKAAAPFQLAFVYPRWEIDRASVLAYAPGAAVLLTVATAWAFRLTRWGKPALAGIVLYLLTLAPALGIVDIYFWRYAFVGDHYHYQSLPILIVGVVYLATQLSEPYARWRRAEQVGYALAAILLAALFALTLQQASIYRDPETVWSDTIAKNPRDFLGRNNLGLIEYQRGRIGKARALFAEAAVANPEFDEAHNNLGLCDHFERKYDEAEKHYRRALEISPHKTLIHQNLASVLRAQAKNLDARKHLQRAVEIDDTNAAAHNMLGEIWEEEGALVEAAKAYAAAAAADPRQFAARFNLGRLLAAANRPRDALRYLGEAAALAPENPAAQHNLGVVHAMLGNWGQAERHMQAALRLDPSLRAARDDLRRVQERGRR